MVYRRLIRSLDAVGERERICVVEGQVLFASADAFTAAVDFKEALEKVTIDVSHSHI